MIRFDGEVEMTKGIDIFKRNSESKDNDKKIDDMDGYVRFRTLLNTIFYITELAGFEIDGHIVLRDTKTDVIWR